LKRGERGEARARRQAEGSQQSVGAIAGLGPHAAPFRRPQCAAVRHHRTARVRDAAC
jgi:hypothetical protein